MVIYLLQTFFFVQVEKKKKKPLDFLKEVERVIYYII